MASHHIHFTKRALERLPIPHNPDPSKGSRYDTYYDTTEKKLCLIITSSGTRTFYLLSRIDGRTERIRLGSFPAMSVENAQKAARIKKSEIDMGINPNKKKQELKAETTLGEFFKRYMDEYSRKHKKSWVYDEREIPQRMGDWFSRKLSQITKQDIQRRMAQISESSGPIAANHFLQRIRAMYNKAKEWGWVGDNPALGIKQNKKIARDRFLQPNELACIHAALDEEANTTATDYIRMSLLTGARKSNVLAMRWEEIDMDRAEWRIPETKNGEPLTVPLTKIALDILTKRMTLSKSPWVFSDGKNGAKHFADPKKPWNRVLMAATIKYWLNDIRLGEWVAEILKSQPITATIAESFKAIKLAAEKQNISLPIGVMDVHLHDLRRTLGSYQAISGANSYVIGKTLGHKSQQSTAIYARLNLDPVRESMEAAHEMIFKHASTK